MRPIVVKPLQEQCVDCIVNNFTVFLSCYEQDNGIIPKRHFEFLQRTYSKILLQKLAIIDSVDPRFLKFIINQYVKDLDLRPTSYCLGTPDVIVERLKVVGSTIRHLDLREKYFVEDTVREIVMCLPSVEELYLCQTESSDLVVQDIGKHCPHVQILDLSLCNITDKGLQYLCQKTDSGEFKPNTCLKRLHIGSTSVTCIGLQFALEHMPNIEMLDHDRTAETLYKLHGPAILNEDKEKMLKVPTYKLNKLDLLHLTRYAECDEIFAKSDQVLRVCAKLCPNIEILTVDNITSVAVVNACCDFKEAVDIKLSTMGSVNYSPFLAARGNIIQSLELDNGVVSLEVLCRSCPNLISLVLQSIRYEKYDSLPSSENPPVFNHMHTIFMESVEYIKEQYEPAHFLIKSCPHLKVLRFTYCQHLDEPFIDSILKCECMATVRKLDFSYSDFTMDMAQKFLLSTPSLETLVIENCNISTEENNILQAFVTAENLRVDVTWKLSVNYQGDIFEHDDVFAYEARFHDFFDFETGIDDDDEYEFYDEGDDYIDEENIDLD